MAKRKKAKAKRKPKQDDHIRDIRFVGGPCDGQVRRFIHPLPRRVIYLDLGRAAYVETRPSSKYQEAIYEFVEGEVDPAALLPREVERPPLPNLRLTKFS